MLGLSCGVQTLACKSKVLDQRWNPRPLHCEHGLSATGPPGGSKPNVFLVENTYLPMFHCTGSVFGCHYCIISQSKIFSL